MWPGDILVRLYHTNHDRGVITFAFTGVCWCQFSLVRLHHPSSHPGPPIVPEMADPAFRVTPIVRDFPVDYSVLLENLVDFDHGPMAHQEANFDMYSGTSKDPQEVGLVKKSIEKKWC